MCVSAVTDFSAEDKASGVEFCTVVHWRPGQGISHFGELCSPRSPKSVELIASAVLAAMSNCGRAHRPRVGSSCVDI